MGFSPCRYWLQGAALGDVTAPVPGRPVVTSPDGNRRADARRQPIERREALRSLGDRGVSEGFGLAAFGANCA
ncbi:MAG: hypothetical protein HYR64_05970 [Fimbriimonas ginsengisoli]|uniref:Uncharacterized protein n=1 Tax=Fimbriimonas ginsengisoli TaxID=1005039 RepID=A0A931LVU6_FIMGI|nr:hypothetical protein [Fimbriimonas ginsengisoli]